MSDLTYQMWNFWNDIFFTNTNYHKISKKLDISSRNLFFLKRKANGQELELEFIEKQNKCVKLRTLW